MAAKNFDKRKMKQKQLHVLAANADIHWEAGAQLLDAAKTPGHRFYSDGTHLSEQGMVELVAALKMDVLEARMMHGSSRRLPKAAAQGCDADLIISDSSLCAVSAKASVHSNESRRHSPLRLRCLQKDTLHVDQHALDAGNDVAADVSKQSLDAAIADFREASFSSKSCSKHANHSAKACDGWKYRLILVDLVPTSDVNNDMARDIVQHMLAVQECSVAAPLLTRVYVLKAELARTD
eukprot:s8064_g3.t1